MKTRTHIEYDQLYQGLVLVVDDEPSVLDILRTSLRQANFNVLVAQDATSALDTVHQHRPDVILLDIMMPDIDGFELCRRLKEHTGDAPVIFLSALTDTANKLLALDLDAVDYITKPFHPAEVVARVKRHFAIHNLQKRLAERNRLLEQEIVERQRLELYSLEQQRLVGAMEERERLGEELRENVGQLLARVSSEAQTIHESLARDQIDRAKTAATGLLETMHTVQQNVREYILGLNTTLSVAERGFLPALRQYLEQFTQEYGLSATLIAPDDLPDGLFSLQVGQSLLWVIREALTNTLKHAMAQSAQVIVTCLANHVQIMVVDDGRGLNDLGLIEKLSSTLPSQKANGESHTGLYLARERLAEIGGQLQIHSKPGQGTTVIVQSPVQRPTFATLAAPLRVLLADDHRLYVQGLQSLLTTQGIEVVGVAHDGLAALEQARALEPDVILMDLDMPECDGLEATRIITAELPHINVIILTVSQDQAHLTKALQSGACGYLLKTTDIQTCSMPWRVHCWAMCPWPHN